MIVKKAARVDQRQFEPPVEMEQSIFQPCIIILTLICSLSRYSQSTPVQMNWNDLQMAPVRSSPRSMATIRFVEQMFDHCAELVHEKFGYSKEQGILYVTPENEKFNQAKLLKVKVKNEGLKLVKTTFRNVDGSVVAGDGDYQKNCNDLLTRGSAWILVLGLNTVWVSKSKTEWGMVVQLIEAQAVGKLFERDQWVLDPSRLNASKLHEAERGDTFADYFAQNSASKAMLREVESSLPKPRRSTQFLETDIEKDSETFEEPVTLKATKAMKRALKQGAGRGKTKKARIIVPDSDEEEEEDEFATQE